MTQPRRICAISVAERVAAERGEPLGISTGYQIRLETQRPRACGSILFCTTGVLLQWLQSDKLLKQCSHIVVDEVHERDVNSDFLLIILKRLLRQRPDLKVVLMSATLNADRFADYFRTNSGVLCPCLNIPKRCFPVRSFYLQDILKILSSKLILFVRIFHEQCALYMQLAFFVKTQVSPCDNTVLLDTGCWPATGYKYVSKIRIMMFLFLETLWNIKCVRFFLLSCS